MGITIRGVLVFCALVLWVGDVRAQQSVPVSPDSRWEESVAAFAAVDREHAPAPGGVVFVGSSSIRLWNDLETSFKDAPVILKRGFGGWKMSDCTRYLDRLVIPYKPRLVLVYAGDNDLAEGRSPQDVLRNFVKFVEDIHKDLPATRIAYISIKPSPARSALIPRVRETNELIRRHIAVVHNLEFIDVFTPMLDASGLPRAELFRADALHLNGAGYALWKTIIAPHVR
jgi:lysophospholipase L1-like esterase